MPFHGLNIAPDDRAAESVRGSKGSIVGQRLRQDRNHSSLGCFPSNSRKTCHLLGDGQQRRKQRRREGPPCVIRSLVLAADRIRLAPQLFHDLACGPHGGRISLDGKGYSPEHGRRSPDKSHERMHGRDGCSLPPQGSKFSAGQSPAGMNGNSSLPRKVACERPCRAGNFGIWNAKPDQFRLDIASNQCPCSHPPRQCTRFRERFSPRTRNHGFNCEAGTAKRHSQGRSQISGTDDGNSRFRDHAGQHSRSVEQSQIVRSGALYCLHGQISLFEQASRQETVRGPSGFVQNRLPRARILGHDGPCTGTGRRESSPRHRSALRIGRGAGGG